MNPLLLILGTTGCGSEQSFQEVVSWGSVDLGNDVVATACLPPDIAAPEDLTTGEVVDGWMDQGEIMGLWQTVLDGGVYEVPNAEEEGETVRLDFSPYSDRAAKNEEFLLGEGGVSGVASDFTTNYSENTSWQYYEFLMMPGDESRLLKPEIEDIFTMHGHFENTDSLSEAYIEVNQPLTAICAAEIDDAVLGGNYEDILVESLSYYIGYRADTICSEDCLEMGAIVHYKCTTDETDFSVSCSQEVTVSGVKVESDGVDEELEVGAYASAGKANTTRLLTDIRAETAAIHELTSAVATNGDAGNDSSQTYLSGGFYNP